MAKHARPPGPKGRPIVGNLYEFKQDMRGFLDQCHKDYGDICWFTIGPMKVCLLSEPTLIRAILQDNAEDVIKPWGLRQLKVALGDGLFTSEGDYWRQQRKLIQQAFHRNRVKEYGKVMEAKGQEMLSTWQDGETRDIHMDSMKTTLAIVAGSLFGMSLDEKSEATIQLALDNFQERFEHMRNATLPIPLNWPTPTNLRLKGDVRKIHEIIQRFIAQRRAQGVDESDLLGWILTRQEDMDLSDKQIIDEMLTLLMAGHETTGSTVSLAMLMVAKHPEVEKKLIAELDAVVGDRAPTEADYEKLVYAQQIIQETMRMYPAAWALSRECTKPLDIGGYCLPKGTQIMVAQTVMHMLPKYFPEPDVFKPERWETSKSRSDVPKYAYLPFGGGARFCIGSVFASIEATLLLTMWLQKYRIELPQDFVLDLQLSISLHPRNGLNVIVKKRLPRANDRGVQTDELLEASAV